jgi:hypothetical protein
MNIYSFLFLVIFLVISSLSSAGGLTTNPQLNQLLDQANQAVQENQQWIEEEGNPAVQRELEYDQYLQNYCNNGYTQACQELTNRYNRRSARTQQLQQQWDNHYNQDWVRSFGR